MSGPVTGTAYTLPSITLLEFATGGIMDTPPIVAGDFVLYRDGVLDGNLDTLPTASGVAVTVQLSGTENTGVANVLIYAHDPDGIWGDWSWSSAVESLSIEAALTTLLSRISAPLATALGASTLGIYVGSVTGASPTTTTLVDSALGGKADNFYINRVLLFTSGVNRYQVASVVSYTGASNTLTFTALTGAAAQFDTYVLL